MIGTTSDAHWLNIILFMIVCAVAGRKVSYLNYDGDVCVGRTLWWTTVDDLTRSPLPLRKFCTGCRAGRHLLRLNRAHHIGMTFLIIDEKKDLCLFFFHDGCTTAREWQKIHVKYGQHSWYDDTMILSLRKRSYRLPLRYLKTHTATVTDGRTVLNHYAIDSAGRRWAFSVVVHEQRRQNDNNNIIS